MWVVVGTWNPKVFNNKSASSSEKLEMHPDLNGNREWKGCALFVVYEVHEHHKSNSMIFEGTDPALHHFVCHFETDKGCLDVPFVLPVPKVTSVGATGFWVYIPAKWFLEQSNKLEGCIYIEALILSDIVAVKECGMRLVCSQHDALEFYEALNIIAHDLDLETYHPPLYCVYNSTFMVVLWKLARSSSEASGKLSPSLYSFVTFLFKGAS
jgi:hypothetical protein